MPSRESSRVERMRAVTRHGHGAQTRNGGRLPYWVHTDGVADICRQALLATGELTGELAEDLILAAYGHDLYEDTAISPADIRAEFGPRVDELISGMTNRNGDDDRAEYLRHLGSSSDDVRVIKCADLIDNMLSVAYGLHDLGLPWAYEFFLPIAGETRDVLLATPFTRLPRTGAYLTGLVDWAWHRLAGAVATMHTVITAGGSMTEEKPLTPEQQKRIDELTFTKDEWTEATAAHEAEEEERAKRLFGDGPRFAIPDTETDS